MKTFEQLSARTLLDSNPDIVYFTNPEGIIEYYNHKQWNRFALENSAPELAIPHNVLGKSLFDFITGEETKESYRLYVKALISRQVENVVFYYSCDSPESQRAMRMTVTPVFADGKPVGILYHSVLLKEETRAPMNHLLKENYGKDLPLLGICSYCKNVRVPPDSKTGIWVSPEEYYKRGGTSNVKLSHGICPECFEKAMKQIHH
jgi:hypothetical protein